VGDVIGVAGFRWFWPRLPGPNCKREVFCSSF